VSRTVTDLVAGSGPTFEDRGEYELKRGAGMLECLPGDATDLNRATWVSPNTGWVGGTPVRLPPPG
jgi:hypothetical protein